MVSVLGHVPCPHWLWVPACRMGLLRQCFLILGISALVCVLFQFCEFLSAPEVSRWAGPIIDVLLDYVGNVQLCSRLKEHIDSFEDWAVIKEKAGTACHCCCCWQTPLPDSGPGLGACDCS